MDLDLVINNGMVIDGTGRSRFRADIGVRDGRIAAVTEGERLEGREMIDASGLIVTPGFIDLHSHADWVLPLPAHPRILAPLLLQGITTVFAGQCGFSPAPVTEGSLSSVEGFSEGLREEETVYRWRSMAEFLKRLEEDGVLLNVAMLAGHGTVRYAAMGERTNAPTAEEIDGMRGLVRKAMDDGAFGLSAGLAYAPGVFARDDELLPLLELVAEEEGLFAVHGRAYSWVSSLYRPMVFGTAHNIRSVRELLALARRSGVQLQLSHQIFVGRRTWRTCHTILREIEQAANNDIDVAFDAFPYTVGNSTVNVVFPDWFLDGFETKIDDRSALRRLKRELDILRWTLGMSYPDITLLWGRAPELAELEGLTFAAIATRLGIPEFDAYMHVARTSGGKARILLGTYSGDDRREEPLQAALSHPLCAFMTDTILTERGKHNPASFGTFPRVLGRYSRDLGLFSLEEAVRRMTSFSADRIGLSEMGRVSKGYWGDLVLLDAEQVADNTGPGRADAPPSGIQAVFVSGKMVAQDGRIVSDSLHGRILRRS
jgi:N-acyl-D-amino-acid deacylase